MQRISALRRPPSLPIQLVRQQYKPPCSNPSSRSLTTCQPSWRPKPVPSSCTQPARRTISDDQAAREMRRMQKSQVRERSKRMYKNGRSSRHNGGKKTMAVIVLIIFGIVIVKKERARKRAESSADVPHFASVRQRFIPFTIVSKEHVSSTSAIFTLRPSTPFPADWNWGVWSVEFKQPELQIARAYTPLPPFGFEEETLREGVAKGDLKFLIRKEYGGEVSNYLFGLPVGATIEIRGPKYEWVLPKDDKIDDVIFLAGGTGIAPALQVARTLFDESRNPSQQSPKMHIIWANRRREDCKGGVSTTKPSKGWFSSWWWADASKSSSPSANTGSVNINVQYPLPETEEPQILYSEKSSLFGFPLTSTTVSYISPKITHDPEPNAIISSLSQIHSTFPFNISINYKVDEENTFIQPKEVQKIVDEVSKGKETRKKVIMVCGPDGFVNAVSGPRTIFKDGREIQNKEVGGMLGNGRLGKKIKEGEWEVVRL